MTVHIGNSIRVCIDSDAHSALEASEWLGYWVDRMTAGLQAANSGIRCAEA
jgi:hypothetical protein